MTLAITIPDRPQDFASEIASLSAIEAIKFYKAHISTRLAKARGKNGVDHRCANHAAGFDSCSTFGLKAFERYPFEKAAELTVKFLQRCRESEVVAMAVIAHDGNPLEAVAMIVRETDLPVRAAISRLGRINGGGGGLKCIDYALLGSCACA